QSGRWSMPIKRATTRFVSSEYGNIVNPDNGMPDAGYAECNQDEVVIAGGGNCADGVNGWLHTSIPQGNGWFANCYGRSPSSWLRFPDRENPAQAYAVCLKKNSALYG
ncbi:hypothetical protein, partial [Chromobacterium subtsugae]|uniref:hypothetical protein n=1 Tax=Chromobacterium subtsugae TaxID=251747 RepID=UPI001AD7F478